MVGGDTGCVGGSLVVGVEEAVTEGPSVTTFDTCVRVTEGGVSLV